MQSFCKFLLQFASEACIISLARKCKLIAIYCNKAHYSCFGVSNGIVSGCSGRISGGHRQDAAFLFLAYLFIEYVENRHGERIEAILAGGGRWGSVPAALLGCVPQCGFSAIASNFYASRVISWAH